MTLTLGDSYLLFLTWCFYFPIWTILKLGLSIQKSVSKLPFFYCCPSFLRHTNLEEMLFPSGCPSMCPRSHSVYHLHFLQNATLENICSKNTHFFLLVLLPSWDHCTHYSVYYPSSDLPFSISMRYQMNRQLDLRWPLRSLPSLKFHESINTVLLILVLKHGTLSTSSRSVFLLALSYPPQQKYAQWLF